MFKFLHTADIHLDSPLKGLERYEGAPVEEIRLATRRALENLVSLAIDRQVDFIVVAGDVYDGDWSDHNTGLFFVKQMNRLGPHKIPVILIAGNHDAANRMTKSLRLPDHVQMLASDRPQTATLTRLSELGVAVHGKSFAQAAETENIVREYPLPAPGMFNIGLLHTSLTGAEGHERYAPCTIDDLKQKDYDYWALGHVHQPQVVSRAPWIVYSGNIQGRHIRETGPKGCFQVTVGAGVQIDAEFVPLDVLRWELCQADVTDIRHTGELFSRFRNTLSSTCQNHQDMPLAVRVKVEGRTECHESLLADRVRWTNEVRALSDEISGGRVWIEKVQIDTLPLAAGSPDQFSEGPLAVLFEYLQQARDDEILCRELAEELDQLRRKLPDELVHGPDRLGLDDPDQIRNWLADIEPMILNRLAGGARP